MFIKIADTIFRLRKINNIGVAEDYVEWDKPNRPTVFIDTPEQQKLIDKFIIAKKNKKERKITGYYETNCFKYVFKNFKFILAKGHWDSNDELVSTAMFRSKALNRSWRGYDQSLYTKDDLKQIEELKIVIESVKGIKKFNL